MKMLALLLLAFAPMQGISVGGPTSIQDPAYPLRIRILQRNATHNSYSAHMWGRADLVVPSEQGFDYDAECGEMFMVTHGDEVYAARWKKPNEQIEMLISRMGTGKFSKCTLKVDLKQYVYVVERGAIVTKPLPK